MRVGESSGGDNVQVQRWWKDREAFDARWYQRNTEGSQSIFRRGS